MWTYKIEHKSCLEFSEGDKVALKEYPDIYMRVCGRCYGGVMCRITDEYGCTGYRVFDVWQLIKLDYAGLVKHVSGAEICLN